MSAERDPASLSAQKWRELEPLIESLLEGLRHGETPAPPDPAGLGPELAEKLRELLPTFHLLERARDGAADGAPVTLGEYHLVRELGRGGMGVVYEAEQTSLGRRVALKVLPYHSLLDARQIERFRREARAAASLQHANIVQVFGAGEQGGIHYYAMQLVEGRALHEVLREVSRLRSSSGVLPEGRPEATPIDPLTSSVARALLGDTHVAVRASMDCHVASYHAGVARVAQQAARALAYAHGRGVLHRDIKPSNILVEPGGTAWIADFGLAKIEGLEEITHSGDIVGTLRYMAPEQLEGLADARSDVYGLGATLYELLTLRPVREGGRGRLLKDVLLEDSPAPRTLDPTIPRDLEVVVERAIQREPDRRYGSAAEMAEDLERFLAGKSFIAVPAMRRGAAARRRRWRAAGVALAAVAALGVAAALMSGRWRRGGPLELPVGDSPVSAAAADLDGDGDLDLAVANKRSGDVSVLLNAGRGAFAPAKAYPAGTSTRRVVPADLDGDGMIDLCAASVESRDVALLWNAGSGAFEAAVHRDLGGRPYGLAVGDLDRDGDADLALTGGAKQVWILRNEGKRQLADGGVFETGQQPNWIELADMDGDRDLDAVTSQNNEAIQVSVLLNDGKGAFAQPAGHALGSPTVGLSVGDCDGDRDQDLAGVLRPSGDVWLLRNRADSSFDPPQLLRPSASVITASFVQLEGSGAPDIVAAGGEGNVLVFKNRSDGSFGEPVNLSFGARPNSVLAADLNGDGRVDLAVTSTGSNSVTVQLGAANRKSQESLQGPGAAGR